MSGFLSRDNLRFLYRTEEGEIGAPAWWSGVAILGSLLVPMTAIWLLLKPYSTRGLDERAFIDPLTLAAYVYLIFYALIVVLIAVCYTNLSAKRFRAAGWRLGPVGLASLLPLFALLAGAAHWLYPRSQDSLTFALVVVCDLALIAIALWHVVVLGLIKQR